MKAKEFRVALQLQHDRALEAKFKRWTPTAHFYVGLLYVFDSIEL